MNLFNRVKIVDIDKLERHELKNYLDRIPGMSLRKLAELTGGKREFVSLHRYFTGKLEMPIEVEQAIRTILKRYFA